MIFVIGMDNGVDHPGKGGTPEDTWTRCSPDSVIRLALGTHWFLERNGKLNEYNELIHIMHE